MFVTFERDHNDRLGVVLPSGDFLELEAAASGVSEETHHFSSMITLIEGGTAARDAAKGLLSRTPEEAVISPKRAALRPPIPRPPRLRDTLMFLEHMENGLSKWARSLASVEADPIVAFEQLMASRRYSLHPVFRERVIYYNADHLSVSGPEDQIIWPSTSDYADFELEWACVIGRAQRGMPATEARSAIFGYTIYNDWSARDIQLNFMQANLGPAEGKDFALSNTIGPSIVTADEVTDPYNLRMIARVNGEAWSEGSTSSMHHRFETAIAQFSRFEDLAPGEVIGSGTVLNGCGYELGRRLSDGDTVELEVEVEGIGTLRNTVRMSHRDSPSAM
jgi:2-keto-4-pentenoate hydratase/2-oxohepta-3-ene-1,7-dioic acid hydratase in catechol pathway